MVMNEFMYKDSTISNNVDFTIIFLLNTISI